MRYFCLKTFDFTCFSKWPDSLIITKLTFVIQILFLCLLSMHIFRKHIKILRLYGNFLLLDKKHAAFDFKFTLNGISNYNYIISTINGLTGNNIVITGCIRYISQGHILLTPSKLLCLKQKQIYTNHTYYTSSVIILKRDQELSAVTT